MTMHKHRIFWAWQHEEEEQWLAQMEAEGWHFKKYNFISYEFEKGEPDQYQYRLELLDNPPAHPESARYIEFMEDMGVEFVDSFLRWAYFRKPFDAEPFELYSDIDGRLKNLRSIYRLMFAPLILLILNLFNLANMTRMGGGAAAVILLIPTVVMIILVTQGLRRIHRKIQKLEQERQLHE